MVILAMLYGNSSHVINEIKMWLGTGTHRAKCERIFKTTYVNRN